MNGYELIFTAIFIVILAAAAGTLGWGIMRAITTLSHHSAYRRGHRS